MKPSNEELLTELLTFQKNKPFTLYKMGEVVQVDLGNVMVEGVFLGLREEDSLGLVEAEIAAKVGSKARFEWDTIRVWVGHIQTGTDDSTYREK